IRYLRILPLKTATRIMKYISEIENPKFFSLFLKKFFIYATRIDLAEAQYPKASEYKNIQDIFTRKLKDGIRMIENQANMVLPCDGKILALGKITSKWVQIIKGQTFNLNHILHIAPDIPLDKLLKSQNPDKDLFFCTIYLSPKNYHHFHAPCDLNIENTKCVPPITYGSLNPRINKNWPQYLSLNERVILDCQSPFGYLGLIAISSLLVNTIQLNIDLDDRETHTEMNNENSENATYIRSIGKGQNIGRFLFGSTIVLIFEAEKDVEFTVKPGQQVLLGQKLF
ncbi:MAG: hypothetical protein MHPSP_002554, partial [Paramarteilia canceri]